MYYYSIQIIQRKLKIILAICHCCDVTSLSLSSNHFSWRQSRHSLTHSAEVVLWCASRWLWSQCVLVQ